MKKPARVFLVIGIIIGFFTIITPIIGMTALNRLNNPRNTNDKKIWGILSLIFVSIIGGIFYLLISDNEFYNDIDKHNQDLFEDSVTHLRELKKLYDNGYIDESTYMEKRKKYIEVI